MLKHIKDILNQPYPDSDTMETIIRNAVVGGFIVFLVLLFFKPFGLDDIETSIVLQTATFGLITALTTFVVESTSKYVLKIRRDVPSWTLWKWIISIMVLILLIALANHFYAVYSFGGSFRDFGQMLYSTFVVAIIPITFFGGVNVITHLKANQNIAKEVNLDNNVSTSVNVSLPVKNSSVTFEVDASKILYLESMQNYVQIHYLDDNEMALKEMHRNTIASLEEILQNHGIKRTHRSYLVNPNMIKSVSGNAQGLKLELEYVDEVVPVSRKYIKEFR